MLLAAAKAGSACSLCLQSHVKIATQAAEVDPSDRGFGRPRRRLTASKLSACFPLPRQRVQLAAQRQHPCALHRKRMRPAGRGELKHGRTGSEQTATTRAAIAEVPPLKIQESLWQNDAGRRAHAAQALSQAVLVKRTPTHLVGLICLPLFHSTGLRV
jgi:hypothetical protein